MCFFALVTFRRASVFTFSLFLLFVACLRDHACSVLVAAEAVGRTRSASAKLPLSFEPNLGQADLHVKFLSRGSGYTLFLTEDEAVVALRESGARTQESGVRRGKTSVVRGSWSVA